ncbi:MAG: transcription repressor NadR [Ileibacterium sp.]|nr:transcription repressor NadR [Ileibacterium sp.]
MKKEERRSRILLRLKQSEAPISGSQLAREFGVSRQVIVSDIKTLKQNYPIESLNSGYFCTNRQVSRLIHVSHDNEEMEKELNCIVDCGCSMVDVKILHPVYGWMSAGLTIVSRKDVLRFLEKVQKEKVAPLTALTQGDHFHTVYGDSEQDLDDLCAALDGLGLLVKS